MVPGKWDSIHVSLQKSLLIFISFLGDNFVFFCRGMGKSGQGGDSWPTKSCKTGSKTPLLQLLFGECGIYCLVTSVKTGTKMVSMEKPLHTLI